MKTLAFTIALFVSSFSATNAKQEIFDVGEYKAFIEAAPHAMEDLLKE